LPDSRLWKLPDLVKTLPDYPALPESGTSIVLIFESFTAPVTELENWPFLLFVFNNNTATIGKK